MDDLAPVLRNRARACRDAAAAALGVGDARTRWFHLGGALVYRRCAQRFVELEERVEAVHLISLMKANARANRGLAAAAKRAGDARARWFHVGQELAYRRLGRLNGATVHHLPFANCE